MPQLPKSATCFTTMGCDVTAATCQLRMSPVEYTDMAGETEWAGEAAIGRGYRRPFLPAIVAACSRQFSGPELW